MQVFLTVLMSVASMIIYGVFHRYQLPLYEWTRLLPAAPIIYAGMKFRRSGSVLTVYSLLMMQMPFVFESFGRSQTLGVNHISSGGAVSLMSLVLGQILYRETESAGKTALLNSVMDEISAGAGEDDLFASLSGLFTMHLNPEKLELFVFNEGGALVSREDGRPLPEGHLMYRVAQSREMLFSRIASEDSRFTISADTADASTLKSLFALPIEYGGEVRAVICASNIDLETFKKDTAPFLITAAKLFESALDLTHKRRSAIAHEAQSAKIKNMFSSYVSRAVAEEILKNPDRIELGGTLLEVTVMFTEITNFSELMKMYNPLELSSLLNDHIADIISSVIAHEGTIDKYIESGVMAFWGAPLPQPDGPVRAVRCAVELQEKIDAMNRARGAAGQPPIEVCIGVNTGPVVAGNIGCIRRMEYTVIGDTVNLASRIKSIAGKKSARILVSGSSYEQTRNLFNYGDEMLIEVKGKTGIFKAYPLM